MGPNTFLLGFPKCGTTSLARYLSAHPSIFTCHPKEPNVFLEDFEDAFRPYKDVSRYEKECFRGAEEFPIRMDCSVWTVLSDKALDSILSTYTDVKFLIVLRNPVDMCQSLHGQALYGHNEDIEDFETAWRKQNNRTAPKRCKDSRLIQYGTTCQIGKQLKKNLPKLPKGSYKIILMDDMKKDMQSVSEDICDFLNIPAHQIKSLEKHNSRQRSRSRLFSLFLRQASRLPVRGIKQKLGIPDGKSLIGPLAKLNSKKVTPEAIRPEFKKELQKYFEEDISIIEELLKRNLDQWRK